MRKLLFLTLLTAFIYQTGFAQTPSKTGQVKTAVISMPPPTFDESTIVKDSSGVQLNYKEWYPLFVSGNYSVKSTQHGNKKPVYVLHKMTAAEKQSLAERRKFNTLKSPPNSTPATASGNLPLNGVAQTRTITETSVVKDSSGVVYPYVVWSAMMRTGDYTLRSNPGDANDTYLLLKKTRQDKDNYAAQMPKPAESDRFKSGDKFVYFKDKDMNGVKFDAKTMAGKVIVLNFWFIGCPPCRAEIPDLNSVAAQYKDNKDVLFVAVCLDEAYDIKEFLKSHPFNYNIIERGQYTADKYGVRLYPTNVIINKQGNVAFSSVSNQPANPYWLKRTIDESLAAN